MKRIIFAFLCILTGCVGGTNYEDMAIVTPKSPDLYAVATIQKITNNDAPVHIYIEGDGHAFNGRGRATHNPTPRSTFVRDMAMADTSPNVVYIARPCQFIIDDKCTQVDWTTGRFSTQMVDSVANAIKSIAGKRPVILVGYSGGAMISGLIIQNHRDINVIQWITIAGVLNHSDWTDYFNDTPLTHSLNLNTLPHIAQVHYVAENDKIVPMTLSKKWIGKNKMIVVPGATHNSISIENLEFSD